MGSCDCGCGHGGGAWQRPCTEPGGCGSRGCDGYGNLPGDRSACLLCGRCNDGRVCPKCVGRALEWLADVPSLHRRLAVEIVPGSSAEERVSSSAPASRPPVDMAALHLLAGSSRKMALPDWQRPAGWTPEEADLSIPEWVAGWASQWRARHRHHRPSLAAARPTAAPEADPPPVRPVIRNGRGELLPPGEIRRRLDDWSRDLAAWQAGRAVAAGEGSRVVLGLGAEVPPADRPDDPLVEKLAHRFGEAPQAFKLGVDCGYLAAWFESACDDEQVHPDLEAFILGLRSLVGRVRAALGERSDLVYLGRCPEPFRDRDTGETAPCGAVIIVDAFVDRIVCKRCRTEWPKERWLSLCALMIDVWGAEHGPSRQAWEAAS